MAVIGEPGEDISRYLSAQAAPQTASSQTAPAADSTTEEAAPTARPQRATGERVFASPRAKRIAREAGVDWTAIAGTGPEGRIVESDVQAYITAQPKATPMARKLAAEAGLELAGIAGTGQRRTGHPRRCDSGDRCSRPPPARRAG